MAAKDYAYRAHGVEMHQRDVSSVVVPDGTSMPVQDLDPELCYHSNFTRVETAEMFNQTGKS